MSGRDCVGYLVYCGKHKDCLPIPLVQQPTWLRPCHRPCSGCASVLQLRFSPAASYGGKRNLLRNRSLVLSCLSSRCQSPRVPSSPLISEGGIMRSMSLTSIDNDTQSRSVRNRPADGKVSGSGRQRHDAEAGCRDPRVCVRA